MGSSEEGSRAVSGAPEAATRNVPQKRRRHGVPKGNSGAAENLDVQEERYHQALKGSSVLVYECDRELRYTFVDNPQPPVTDPALILERRDDEILPAESVQEMVAIKKLVLATGKGQRREICIRNGEKRYYFDFLAEPMRGADESITGLRGVVVDITARRQAEEALRQSEEWLRALVTASSDVVYRISPDWKQMLQLRGKDFIPDTEAPSGTWLEKYIPPEDQRHVMAVIKKAIRRKSVFELEHRVVRVDGTLGWTFSRAIPLLDAKGEITEWFGAASDMTRRKETELALRESEERTAKSERLLSELVEECPFGIYIVDSDFRIAKMNVRSQEGTFRNVRPVIGRRLDEAMRALWPEAVAVDVIGRFQHTLDSGEPYCSRDFINPRVDVEAVEAYEWELHRIVMPDGQHGVICYYFDSTELRPAQEAARESERHERERASELAALLDAAPTPVFIAHDPECLHLTGNRAAAEFLRQAPGRETSLSAPEEVRPRHFKAVKNGRELRTDEFPAQRAARGVPVKDFEFSLVFNDGTTRDVVGYGTPLRDAQGRPRGAIHVLVDITERKRAEEQLRQAHERLTYHTQNTPLAVIEFDAELQVCAWSDGAQRVFGWEASEVLGRRIFDIPWVLEEDRPAIEQVAAGLRTGRTRRSVSANRNVRKDGKVIWCEWYNSSLTDASGKMQSIQSLVLEVTERREAEQALQRSEARLAQAMQVGRLGTFEHDHVAEVLEFSPLMRELAGFGETERVTVDSILARVAAEDRHELAAAIRRAHDPTGNGMFRAEYRVVRSGGEVRWLSARSQTFFEGEGSLRRPVRTLGAVLDVTQRKEAQAGLERLVAERTAKLQELVGELEHFSYSITHDMREPLRAMRGFAELLKESVDKRLGQEEQMFVGRIIIGAERMDALIADALSYSKAVRQELAVAPVDVGKLLRGMLDTYPEFQSTNAAITIDGELPIVMGNEAGLTQCFSNLLVNAVKFVQEEKKAKVRVRGENRGGWVRLWVEDNGVGIPGEMLSRVFDMFSRGTSPAAGTGIGLALVRKVVDRMGGKVGVESEVGRGSRFWVELRAGDLGHKGLGGRQ
jgi:PAS domain S-box-containing protein